MTLPALGNLTYNGVTWPVETSTVIDFDPIRDPASRAIMYVNYRITCTGIITATSLQVPNQPAGTPGEPTDTVMAYIRQQLQVPGGALTFNSKGFGDLSVNGGGVPGNTKLDVLFGPMPRISRWAPIGGLAAAEVVWSIEVHLPECCSVCGTATYKNKVMALTYSQEYGVDKDGYTTMSVSGNMMIPMTRVSVGNKTLPDSAHNYFNEVPFFDVVPLGFRRTTNNRGQDQSKQKLKFNFVFTEMAPNILPPGSTDCDASQSWQSDGKTIFAKYFSTMSMSITLDKNRPRWWAMDYFLYWVQQRYNQMVLAGANPIPIKFSFGEPSVFGRGPTGQFALTFWISSSNLTNLRAQSALWLPPGFTHPGWLNAARNDGTQSMYGMANMSASSSDDTIVDLCAQQLPAPNTNALTASISFGGRDFGMLVACPLPQNSWMYYRNTPIIGGDSNVVHHKTLPDQVSLVTVQDQGSTSQNTLGPALGVIVGVTATPPSDYYQQRTTPNVKVRLVGEALRVCYPIWPPQITSIGGQPVLKGRDPIFFQEQIASYGVPIFHASWDMEYLVPYTQSTITSLTAIPFVYENGMTLVGEQQVQLQANANWQGNATQLSALTPLDWLQNWNFQPPA